MPNLKLLVSLFLGLAVLMAQVGVAGAAAPRQDASPITGTIQGVIVETNSESGLQTVVITLLVDNETQMVRISVESAVTLGLIVVDESGVPVVVESMFGSSVDIDTASVIPDATSAPDDRQNPKGTTISELFSNIFGLDYEMVMSARSNGFGFGIITQSLWMTQKLGGDATLFLSLLDAKKSHDYSAIDLPFGKIPQNWGQLKKALLHTESEPGVDDGTGDKKGSSDNNNRDGKQNDEKGNNGKSNNPGNEKIKNENSGNGLGNTEKPGNGGGNGNIDKPVTPPGQGKDKSQDKTKDDKVNNGNGKTK